MSCLSNVTIVCDESTYEKIRKVCKEDFCNPVEIYKNKHQDYKLYFKWVKWGISDFSYKIEKILMDIDEDFLTATKDPTGAFAYLLVEGELPDDIMFKEYGDTTDCEYYMQTDIGGCTEFQNLTSQNAISN